jgi:hypothetical protein
MTLVIRQSLLPLLAAGALLAAVVAGFSASRLAADAAMPADVETPATLPAMPEVPEDEPVGPVGPVSLTTRPTSSPTTQPAGPDGMKEGDESEEITNILGERPAVPVTPVVTAKPAAATKPVMPVEGSGVVERRCRLGRDGETGWYVLEFLDVKAPPRRVLPCALLERMQELTAQGDVKFRVSGESLSYRGKAYVMPEKVVLDQAAEPVGPKLVAAETEPEPASKPAPETKPSDAVADASAKPGIPGTQPISPDEIIKRLLQDRPGEPVLPTPRAVAAVAPAASVAPARNTGEVAAAGKEVVIDRLARLVKERGGDWWEAHFESDNTLEDQPVLLLPCLVLERNAERLTTGNEGGYVKFRLSGELTEYKGRQFLLLRKVIIERPMNQF